MLYLSCEASLPLDNLVPQCLTLYPIQDVTGIKESILELLQPLQYAVALCLLVLSINEEGTDDYERALEGPHFSFEAP